MKTKLVIGITLLFLATACDRFDSPRVKEAKTLLREKAHDPDSLQFRGIFIGKGDSVCGEYNAKNRMGGYGGFERFVVYLSLVYTAEQWGNDKFENEWRLSCENLNPTPSS